MLNNINSRRLSKSKTFQVLNFPGATRSDLVGKTDYVQNEKPESLIVHVGTNNLTNKINFLNNIKNCNRNKAKITQHCIKLFKHNNSQR